MMRRMIQRLILTGSLLPLALCGQHLSSLTAAFVDVGIGARPLGFGGAYSALARNADAAFWNPAGLAYAENAAVEFSRVKQFGVIPYNSISASVGFGGTHALGVALLHSGDEIMTETSTYISYAFNGEDVLPQALSRLRLGVNLKLQFANFGDGAPVASDYPLFDPGDFQQASAAYVEGDAGGFGLDFGAAFEVNDKCDLALVFRNVISTISWDNGEESYSEDVPNALIFGAAYRPARGLTLAIDFDESLTSDRARRLHFGSEKVLIQQLAIRAGMGQRVEAGGERDYAMGLGLNHRFPNWGKAVMDYAFQMHPLENMHRFTLGFQFE